MAALAVLGAGAWGTAIAAVLASRHRVTLWARDPAQAEAIRSAHRNDRYLPGVVLPESVAVERDLDASISGADLLLAATPVAGLRDLCQRLKGRKLPLVWLCKGFEEGTGLLAHHVVEEVLGKRTRCGALSGPSFALEVARGLPCALTLASRDGAFAQRAAALLHGGCMRVYYSTDLVGVEIGGAVKNVMAIAAGISDGLGLGQNARAALITRGLAEITRLGVALGGAPETLMGLSGAGDLILTATGDLSRNRRVGLELAKGRGLQEVLRDLGHVAEGVRSAEETLRLAARHGVEMPVTQAVNAVLRGEATPAAAVELLLARDPTSEVRPAASRRRRIRAAARPRTRQPRRRSRG
jgi:glycerol-3-phosphate dehydrogenase (NAD(P)+)